MNGTALRSVRTRRRAVALAAVTAFALTATACSGGESASTTTTKSRADLQREAAEKDGTLNDLSLVSEGSDVSAAESVDAMRVTAVGKTRTDAAATAGTPGGGGGSAPSQGAATPQAPRPTSSGSATPPAQTPVVPWSGIETQVEVTPVNPSTVSFVAKACNTTTRQRTIVQNTSVAGVTIQSDDGAKLEFPASSGGGSNLTIAPSECRVIPLVEQVWNRAQVPLTGNDYYVKVNWNANELGTDFSKDFESSWFTVAPS